MAQEVQGVSCLKSSRNQSTIVRIAAVVALLPVAFAAKAATDVAKVMKFTDAACTTAHATPHYFHKMAVCVKSPGNAAGESYKGACTGTTVTLSWFTDVACATPAAPATTEKTKTCGGANDMELVDSCSSMDCEGADMAAMTCTATKAASENNSSDNAVTASMSGVVVLSAAALIFA